MTRRRVTLRDVAARAGVDPGTASRALSDDPGIKRLVNEQTAERVRLAAADLDYHPNPVARSLKTRRSHTVGVVIPDLTNPVFPPIVRGIEDRLMHSGYVALVGNSDNDPEREHRLLERMQARQVDGLILATARRKQVWADGWGQHEVPVVLVNRTLDDQAVPSVATDDVRGIQMAMAHLVELGHRRIAHVAGPQDFSTGAGRYRGFVLSLQARGLDLDGADVVTANAFSVAEGLRCCRDLLARPSRPTAVVAANDMLALGCYQAINEAGLTCPDDISVVGFNDMPFIDRLLPPLTSVRFPHRQMGVEAGQLILELIAEPQSATKVLFVPPELIVRGSTAPARQRGRRRPPRAASGPVVADAAVADGAAVASTEA